jgi:hypothetical protein
MIWFRRCLLTKSGAKKFLTLDGCCAGTALEALLSLARFAVGLVGQVCMYLAALVCFVTSGNAARDRS